MSSISFVIIHFRITSFHLFMALFPLLIAFALIVYHSTLFRLPPNFPFFFLFFNCARRLFSLMWDHSIYSNTTFNIHHHMCIDIKLSDILRALQLIGTVNLYWRIFVTFLSLSIFQTKFQICCDGYNKASSNFIRKCSLVNKLYYGSWRLIIIIIKRNLNCVYIWMSANENWHLLWLCSAPKNCFIEKVLIVKYFHFILHLFFFVFFSIGDR